MMFNGYPKTVYAIQHKPTGKIYVGSSNDAEERIKSHIRALRANRHNNTAMQEDFNKYGDEYEWFALDTIASYEERGKEFYWMEKLNTNDPEIGYNGGDPYFRACNITYPEFKEGYPIPNKKGEM